MERILTRLTYPELPFPVECIFKGSIEYYSDVATSSFCKLFNTKQTRLVGYIFKWH